MVPEIFKIINYLKYKVTKPNSKIGYGSILDKESIIKSNVNIGGNSIISNSEIGNNVLIENNVDITESIIKSFTRVYRNNSLFAVMLDSYSYIAPMGYIGYTNIGKFCSIGHRFQCAGANHPIDRISTSPAFYSLNKQCGISFTNKTLFNEIENIIIENDVWIGSNVFIKGGVKIGNGAIVAAGSVVVDNVPDYAIVAGVPARVLKFRFEKDVIEKLLKICWWDLEVTYLKELQPMIFSADFQNFFKEIEKIESLK